MSEETLPPGVPGTVGYGQAVAQAVTHAPTHGPGTELKKLLSRVGITASPDCSCNAKARLMDERGIEWCEANIDEIVVWLRESAGERGLPFLEIAAKVLVRRAIHNARKAAQADKME